MPPEASAAATSPEQANNSFPAPGKWLADEMHEAFLSVPGSPERSQLILFLKGAERIYLTHGVVRAVSETLENGAGTILGNLQQVQVPPPALWLEYDHAPRLLDGLVIPPGPAAQHDLEKTPVRVGTLLCRDPWNEDRVSIFMCWKTSRGSIFHSYAIMEWSLPDLLKGGVAANQEDATEALMGYANAAIPRGLEDEMRIWQAPESETAKQRWMAANDGGEFDRARQQTIREVLGENLFLLGALVMLGSSGVSLQGLPGPAVANPKGSDAWQEELARQQREHLDLADSSQGPSGEFTEPVPDYSAALLAPPSMVSRLFGAKGGGFRKLPLLGEVVWTPSRKP